MPTIEKTKLQKHIESEILKKLSEREMTGRELGIEIGTNVSEVVSAMFAKNIIKTGSWPTKWTLA